MNKLRLRLLIFISSLSCIYLSAFAQNLPVSSHPSLEPSSHTTPSTEVNKQNLPNPANSTEEVWKISINNEGENEIVVEVASKLPLLDQHWQTIALGGYIPLLLSLEIFEGRWYWFDKDVINVKLPIRITHDNINNNYVGRIFGQNKIYQTKEEVIEKLLYFNWQTLSAKNIPKGEYSAQLKLAIDRRALSPLLQVDATTNRLWQWEKTYPLQKLKIE